MIRNSTLLASPLITALMMAPLQAHAEHVKFSDILPILQENCLVCHRNPGAPNQLSMETFEEMMQGSKHGQVVIKGDPDSSELIKRVKGESGPRMPFNGPPYLSELEIQMLENWIDNGLNQ